MCVCVCLRWRAQNSTALSFAARKRSLARRIAPSSRRMPARAALHAAWQIARALWRACLQQRRRRRSHARAQTNKQNHSGPRCSTRRSPMSTPTCTTSSRRRRTGSSRCVRVEREERRGLFLRSAPRRRQKTQPALLTIPQQKNKKIKTRAWSSSRRRTLCRRRSWRRSAA